MQIITLERAPAIKAYLSSHLSGDENFRRRIFDKNLRLSIMKVDLICLTSLEKSGKASLLPERPPDIPLFRMSKKFLGKSNNFSIFSSPNEEGNLETHSIWHFVEELFRLKREEDGKKEKSLRHCESNFMYAMRWSEQGYGKETFLWLLLGRFRIEEPFCHVNLGWTRERERAREFIDTLHKHFTIFCLFIYFTFLIARHIISVFVIQCQNVCFFFGLRRCVCAMKALRECDIHEHMEVVFGDDNDLMLCSNLIFICRSRRGHKRSRVFPRESRI